MLILGIILFLISVFCLIQKKYVYSIFLFILFGTKGLSILPENLGGLKLSYLAFVYVIIFMLLKYKQIKLKYKDNKTAKYLAWLLIFFVTSIVVSIFYYGYPVIDTIITGLRYFVLLSFFVFYPLSSSDYQRLMRWLFYITFITTILYILQCITGVQLLAYSLTVYEQPTENGLFRFYNEPPLISLFLYPCFFYKEMIPARYRIWAAIVFLLAIFLSNGRTSIFVMILTFIFIAFLCGNIKQNVGLIAFFVLSFLFVQPYVMSRMENSGKTSEDLTLVLRGAYHQADYQSKDGYTMLYRFAWINERWKYLSDRPLIEKLYGLGLLPDEHPMIKKKYHFRYGLVDEDTGYTAQMRTPDIAWGNFLTCYGLLGTALFFIFYFSIVKNTYKLRKYNNLATILFVTLSMMLVSSFSGALLSEPYSLVGLFLFYNYMMKLYANQKFNNNSNYSLLQCSEQH